MCYTWLSDLASRLSDTPEHPDMLIEVRRGKHSPRSLSDFLMFIIWTLLTPLDLRLGITRAEVSLWR